MSDGYNPQGSAGWLNDRAGKVTGSRLGCIMPNRVRVTKDNPLGYSASRYKYMLELLCERLTGIVQQHFVNADMERGLEEEPLAAAAYDARKGVMSQECGFFDHPTIPRYGATPDRLVGTDGVLEIKDPTTGTHVDTILGAEIDYDYLCQMAAEVDCTGRQWADFVSYDSRLPGDLAYFCKRYFPPQDLIEEIHEAVIQFNKELDQLEARVRAYKPDADDTPVTAQELDAAELDIF